MNRLVRASLLSMLLAAAACGGGADGDLDPDVVTNLPPGDATGTGLSGTFSLETVTTSCAGDCATTVDGFTYSACDIGARLVANAEVDQADGALAIDVTDSDYVSQLAGGVDTDGSFDVGGLKTENGGAVTITARAIGALTPAGIAGTARLYVDGMGLGCTIGVDLDGAPE